MSRDWELEKRLEDLKDAEIERLKAEIAHLRDEVLVSLRLSQKQLEVNSEKDAEIHRLKRDLVDAVQNIQAHSMIVDASEKDIEIERLKALITELADALEKIDPVEIEVRPFELIQRAREAAK